MYRATGEVLRIRGGEEDQSRQLSSRANRFQSYRALSNASIPM